MLRIQKLLIKAAILALLWLFTLNHSQDFPPAVQPLILWAPVVALLLFGLYLFIWLILGVATFRTVPEEAESLQVDIARAKKELAKRGIKIT